MEGIRIASPTCHFARRFGICRIVASDHSRTGPGWAQLPLRAGLAWSVVAIGYWAVHPSLCPYTGRGRRSACTREPQTSPVSNRADWQVCCTSRRSAPSLMHSPVRDSPADFRAPPSGAIRHLPNPRGRRRPERRVAGRRESWACPYLPLYGRTLPVRACTLSRRGRSTAKELRPRVIRRPPAFRKFGSPDYAIRQMPNRESQWHAQTCPYRRTRMTRVRGYGNAKTRAASLQRG